MSNGHQRQPTWRLLVSGTLAPLLLTATVLGCADKTSLPPVEATGAGAGGEVEQVQASPTPATRASNIPASGLPASTDEALAGVVRQILGDEQDEYGVVITRVDDGSGVALNPDKTFFAASLYKLAVLYEVMRLVSIGELHWDDELVMTPDAADAGLGYLPVPLGGTLSVADATKLMVTVSDNASGFMLMERAGVDNIHRQMDAIGMPHTRVGMDLQTSAGDMARLLALMLRGEAVNPAASYTMLELMGKQTVNDRLPALLPDDVTVAHKTGNWDEFVHDVGVIYAPSGTYLIVVLSEEGGEDATERIAQLSRAVYNLYQHRYGFVTTSLPAITPPVWQ